MSTKNATDYILSIDTSGRDDVRVTLEVDGVKYSKTKAYGQKKSQIVLPLVRELLSDQDLSITDLTELQVNPGPGSYTGLRVGVSVVNAIGFFLTIPINEKPSGILVEPKYS